MCFAFSFFNQLFDSVSLIPLSLSDSPPPTPVTSPLSSFVAALLFHSPLKTHLLRLLHKSFPSYSLPQSRLSPRTINRTLFWFSERISFVRFSFFVIFLFFVSFLFPCSRLRCVGLSVNFSANVNDSSSYPIESYFTSRTADLRLMTDSVIRNNMAMTCLLISGLQRRTELLCDTHTCLTLCASVACRLMSATRRHEVMWIPGYLRQQRKRKAGGENF